MKTTFFQHALKKTARSLLFISYRIRFSLGSALAPQWTAATAARLFCTPIRPKPAKLAPAMDIPSPQVREVSLPGGAVSLYQWGDPGSQPTVLLVHGWNGWGLQFASFLPALLAHGFAVIAVDHVGHGRSHGKHSSLPTFIRTIKDLLVLFPSVCGIVGHSLGAAAAAYVLAESGTRKISVVLLAPPQHPRVFLEQFGRLLGMSRTVVNAMQHWMEERFSLPFAAVDADRVAPLMKARTLVIHDPADEVVPFSHGARYAELVKSANLAPMTGIGHYKMLSSPEVIRLATAFLIPQPIGLSGSAAG